MIRADREITAGACAWVAQLESGDISSADLAALREWIGRSPAHETEIRAVAQLAGQLSTLTELADGLEALGATSLELRRRRRKFTIGLAVAAMGMAAFACLIVVAVFPILSPDSSPQIYHTAIGESRAVELADGSKVTLNADSQLEVDFNDETRRVRLVTGEALFDVAHNPARPFLVYTDIGVFEAVGTSFIVHLRQTETELDVVDGVVAFTRLPASSWGHENDGGARAAVTAATPHAIVEAGHSLTAPDSVDRGLTAPQQYISALSPRELQRRLSWTEGLFDFSETPLDEVVAEVSRQSGLTFEFADPELRELKFGGIFRTGDIDALLDGLEALGVRANRIDAHHVVLEANASSEEAQE